MQNIDTPQINPLSFPTVKPTFKIPKNPKIIILVILTIIILLLLITSLFIHPQTPTSPKNKPTITQTPTPSTNAIPTNSTSPQFTNELNQIDTLFQENLPLDPPQIDSNIKI